MYCIYSVYVLYIQRVCTVYTACMYYIYSVYVLYIQRVCTVHTACMYCVHSVYVLYIQRVCTVYTVCMYWWDARCRSWLRHCATSRKVAGSIPDGVIWIFYWHNPSGRTMTLGLTQPLTEMSTRNISWGWRRPVRTADNLTTFMCRLSWSLGASTSWSPHGLSRPVMGLLYLYLYLFMWHWWNCRLQMYRYSQSVVWDISDTSSNCRLQMYRYWQSVVWDISDTSSNCRLQMYRYSQSVVWDISDTSSNSHTWSRSKQTASVLIR